jgi:ABC-2 type transport system ATP-binding protein
MIQAVQLSKRYGRQTAVDDLSFTVRPGRVTGFLGPNGAGKSTTMRLILGLDRPTAGTVTIDGIDYQDRRRPLWQVGALLDASAVPAGRTAGAYLAALAASNHIPGRRVGAVLEQVGLTEAARRRIGGFSLGMKQRMGIAAALLGDPGVLIFDEPVNGLDPQGIRWIRDLFARLAAEGRTVLVSSHLMSEMAQTAQDLIVIGRGRLVAATSVAAVTAAASHVLVGTDRPGDLLPCLHGPDDTVAGTGDGLWRIDGHDARHIGRIAAGAGIALHELHTVTASLEEAFMTLTGEAAEYTSAAALASPAAPTSPAALTSPEP